LRLPRPDGLWVRLAAMFMLILAYYCYRAAREEERRFIVWSLAPRPLVLSFLVGLVAIQRISAWILLFGVFDVVATLWTLHALRAEQRGAEPTRRY
jgi:hypothetical protein